MKITPLTKEHYPMMATWYKKRGLGVPSLAALPKIGFISPGYAASFLYAVETGWGWSDGTVTNPDAPKTERQQARMQIFGSIIKDLRNV